MTRTCKHASCGKSFEPTDSRQEFCDSTCRANHHYAAHPEKGRPVPSSPLQSVATHPLAEARAEQEAADLNSKLGQLVYQAIIDHLAKHGQVHADDLEDYYPPEHRDRCRKLLPGQLGSLRGRKYIQPTTEYRKSKVKARKSAKSWVYIFTLKGRGLVGVGGGNASAASGPPVDASGHSPHSSGTSSTTNTGKGPAREPESSRATLDRPELTGARLLDDGVKGSSTAPVSAVGEPTALPGLEEKPRSAWTDPDLGEAA